MTQATFDVIMDQVDESAGITRDTCFYCTKDNIFPIIGDIKYLGWYRCMFCGQENYTQDYIG